MSLFSCPELETTLLQFRSLVEIAKAQLETTKRIEAKFNLLENELASIVNSLTSPKEKP